MNRNKAPLWIRVAVFFAIMATGIDCNAGTIGKPVKQLTWRDMLQAVVAVALCKPETEVADIVAIELVSVTVDGETKQVYSPVKKNDKNITEGE